jgi:hypothetical protein
LGGRRGGGCWPRHAADHDAASNILQCRGADAGNIPKIVDGFEGTVFSTVVDNGLRLARADALEAVQFVYVGGVDIDLGKRKSGQQQAAADQGKEFSGHVCTLHGDYC